MVRSMVSAKLWMSMHLKIALTYVDWQDAALGSDGIKHKPHAE